MNIHDMKQNRQGCQNMSLVSHNQINEENYKCFDFQVYDKSGKYDEEQVCARLHFQISVPYYSHQ